MKRSEPFRATCLVQKFTENRFHRTKFEFFLFKKNSTEGLGIQMDQYHIYAQISKGKEGTHTF